MLTTSKIPSVLGMNSWVRFQVGDSLLLVEEMVCLDNTNQNNSFDSAGSAPWHRHLALSQSTPAPKAKGTGRVTAWRFFSV